MKKYFTSILLVLAVQQMNAATFYDQLCEFNFNWKKYKNQAPAGETRIFKSDKDFVFAHLSCVLPILKSNAVKQLTTEQQSNRKHLIDLLDGYRITENFPVNYYRHQRIPVFIDENKTHCAVAYLLQQTNHESMALRIAAADNYAWLKNIYDVEFFAWQQLSGLTLEELELIQGAYDYYEPFALQLPNKYEVPQKPSCILIYFDDELTAHSKLKKWENIWCMGEGENGVLNGRWEQYFSVGMPWIVGYYEAGKRSGKWEEYYQGTKQLCRTENWRNDKLNGIRKRFDRSGILIEEILFKDGMAITKTNYDLKDSLIWIRRPLDSNLVYTEVFTFAGSLIASGHEKVFNPGNLLWFQNIELTALNAASISSRELTLSNQITNINDIRFGRPYPQHGLYNTPPLVEYKKEGDWMYYKEFTMNKINSKSSIELKAMLLNNYKHFGKALSQSIIRFDDLNINKPFDSVRVSYANNYPQNIYGFSPVDYSHLQIRYYDNFQNSIGQLKLERQSRRAVFIGEPRVKECGQYNIKDERIGIWKHFDENNTLYMTENFIIARKEDDED